MGAASSALRAYTDAVQANLLVDIERADDSSHALERAAALPPGVRDLLDVLLLHGGAGEPVDPSWAGRIEKDGQMLWQHGFLLPRSAPSRGSRIDPKWYAASARLNRALRGRRPFRESLPEAEFTAALPPSRSIWDAVVVAAELERNPRRLTKDGSLRKDERERLIESLGETGRWDLALRHAWATGLIRPAKDRLYGFPEAHPRRLVDPVDRDAGRRRARRRRRRAGWMAWAPPAFGGRGCRGARLVRDRRERLVAVPVRIGLLLRPGDRRCR